MNEKLFLENSDIPPNNIKGRCPVCLDYIINGDTYVVRQRLIDDNTIEVIYCSDLCALREIDNHPGLKQKRSDK